ncbi:MAG: S41 family peptidase [Phototrophicaceae bacterium]
MEHMRKHHQKLSTALLLVVIFLAGYVIGGLNTTVSKAQGDVIGDIDEAFAPLYETFQLIQARYVSGDEVDVDTLVDGAITGMIEALDDPFSSYLDPQSFNNFTTQLSGDVEGIGVVIFSNDDEQIEVQQVFEGTGAEQAGVLPGDIFIEVDGLDVTDFDQTQLGNVVRGDAGTTVTITFLREGEEVTLTITRVRFEVPNVDYELLEESNMAYISMADFNDRSRGQLDDAIAALDVNSRAGLVFDLRDNPGGTLASAVDVASAFIEDGVVLYESFADGTEQVFETNGNYAGITVPIVVLINENSASASELVSGAMQDAGVATVLGEVSFGKGTVQTIQPLSNNGAVRLTIARYLLPSRRWIHEVGVTPDIIIELDEVEFADGDPDVQLDGAVDFIINGQ